MLADNAFLKNLHVGIPQEDRLVLEGAGFAIEAVGYAYEHLREIAARFAVMSDDDHRHFSVTPLFLHAWAIIDNVHLTRSLLKRTTFTGDQVRRFIAETEVATLLRNKFDHISTNVKNLASKANPMALFGALSIHQVRDQDLMVTEQGQTVLKGFRVLQINAGKPKSMQHALAENDGKPVAIELPVGRFLLQAFDLEVNLSALVAAVREVVQFYDEKVGPRIAEQVRDAALAQGVDPERELSNTGISMVIHAEVDMLPDLPEVAKVTE